MPKTVIHELNQFGQSVWLDNINRGIFKSGKLKEMIDKGLKGITSNPTIFDKAISGSNDYDEKIRELSQSLKSTFEIYDELTIRDIQDAADIFMPIYQNTDFLDGYVSLEVNPQLAYSSKETIEEGRRLYKKVNRPNVMFKVPSTPEGLKAVEELIALGININVTLIFSLEQYEDTASAYIKGIKRFLEKGGDISKVHSVASVFVSRIDTLVDKSLEEKITKETDGEKRKKLNSLKGKAAVANAQLIYKKYLDILASNEFKKLQSKGANIQRVLWGSTSTKNPQYSDIKYVTELIGRNTVNTMPEATFEAFLDHGEVKEALFSQVVDAQSIIADLKSLGIEINEVCRQLLKEGVAAFEESFTSLLKTIERKKEVLTQSAIG